MNDNQKFITTMYERRCWRDGHNVTHELRPRVGYALMSDEHFLEGWFPTCGYKRRSTVEHNLDYPVTCIFCLGTPENP